MADAINVFDPAFRVTSNTTGAPLSGAVIKFYDAGTTSGKTVYSDADLTVALGTSVTTDSLGCPTSDGSSATLIYTDTQPYKVRIETSAGVLIKQYDNVKGAVTGGTGSSGSVVATRVVETKSLDYTVVAADQNKCLAVNSNSADRTITLPSAAASTIGNGWFITVSHSGTANQVIIATVSSQTITSGALTYGTTFALSNSGEEVTLYSDGGNWRVFQHTGPHIKRGQGILTVADRLSAAPGSPVEGSLYISTGAATWGSTSMANHDIAMFTSGSNWVKITPPTDCGWMAFVQDEDIYYRFVGSAWVAESATTSVAGTVLLATQAVMETATSTTVVPPVGRMHFHPAVAKAWALFNGSGTAALTQDYGVASLTDNGTGNYTLATDTAFSSIGYATPTSTGINAGTGGRSLFRVAGNTTVTTVQVISGFGDDEANFDPIEGSVSWFGDQ